MVFNNRPSQRQSDAVRSNKLIFIRIGLFLAATVFVLLTLFGASTRRDDVPRDDINEEEVSVEEIPEESIEEEHEIRDVSWRPVIFGAFGLLAVAIIIHVAFWWVLERWTGDELRFDPQVPPALAEIEPAVPDIAEPDFPGPDLQAAPALEYESYLLQQLEFLESYGQSDTEEGFARIPISRAMELLAEEGLPARDGEIPDFGLDPAYELESEGGQEFDPILVEEEPVDQ